MLKVLAKIKEIDVQKIAVSVIAVICAFILIIQTTSAAYASDESATVMDELNGMTVDGKAFDASDYPADAEGVPQLLNLYEGGYSFYTEKQEHYGLLLYIYNPAQIEVKDDIRNTVQMMTGEARPEKYKLKLLEVSEDKLFCKFLVDFTEEEKAGVLATLDREERRYDVNSIELYVSGANATSYPIERLYIYKGYEAGYGADGESTIAGSLSYTEEGGEETVRIAVKHTTWRPEGSKQDGESKYIQDSIHSVYFAIPNETAAQYDYLNKVKVEYWEAYTKPIFVTGNSEIYNAVKDLVLNQLKKEVIDDGNIGTGADGTVSSSVIAPEKFDFSGFSYALAGGREWGDTGQTNARYTAELTFNVGGSSFDKEIASKQRLQSLFWYYLVEGDAGKQPISPHKLAEYVQSAPFYNDRKVAGKYPSYLFESYDTEKYTDEIPVGREYTLTSEKVTDTWFEHIFGKTHIENKEEFEAVAIQEVESLTGNKTTDCANYYVGENDYSEFKAFYEANKKNSTVYLLRFATSEYTQMQVYTYQYTSGVESLFNPIKEIDYNSYFGQTKVYLDFDVIYLEYMKDNKSYVIPVNMSPIDIFPELTPPVYWDEPASDFWRYGCGIIGGLIAVWAVYVVAEKALRR